MIFDLIRRKPLNYAKANPYLTLRYLITMSQILPFLLLWWDCPYDFHGLGHKEISSRSFISVWIRGHLTNLSICTSWWGSSDRAPPMSRVVQRVWTSAVKRELCPNPLGTGQLWKVMFPLQENFKALRWVSLNLSHQGAHCHLNVNAFCLSRSLINC